MSPFICDTLTFQYCMKNSKRRHSNRKMTLSKVDYRDLSIVFYELYIYQTYM